MLFFSKNKKYITINRSDFINDTEYYKAILKIKGIYFDKKQTNEDIINDMIIKLQ